MNINSHLGQAVLGLCADNCLKSISHVLGSRVARCIILLLTSKYKHSSHSAHQQRHRESKQAAVTQFLFGGGRPRVTSQLLPSIKTRWWAGISPCHMISTVLLYSIQSMLNSCERLSATVTAKKVTLILSTIVLLQGLPAGSTEKARGGGEVSTPSSLCPGCLQGGCHTHALSPA